MGRVAAGQSVGPGDGRVRVLIADDDQDHRWLLREWVQAAGPYDVVALAEDGRQAVAAGVQARPEVAVLDLSMPLMDGLQAAAELRRLLPECRIVIQSSFTAERMGQHAIDAGADAYVEKSFTPGPLLAALEGLAPVLPPTSAAAEPTAPEPLEEATELRRLRTSLEEAERRLDLVLGLLLEASAAPMALLRAVGGGEWRDATGFDVVRANRAAREVMARGGCAVPVGHVGPADPLLPDLVTALRLGELETSGLHLLRTSPCDVLVRCRPDASW